MVGAVHNTIINRYRDHFPEVRVEDTALEFLLSFLVILVHLSATTKKAGPSREQAGLSTGLAYAASLSVYRGALNPARAVASHFVANR